MKARDESVVGLAAFEIHLAGISEDQLGHGLRAAFLCFVLVSGFPRV
jgi:hypothetical protein